MTILFISTVYEPYHLGGAEISTKLLAEGLALIEGNRVAVLTHGKKDTVETINNVKVIRKNFGVASKTVFDRCENKNSRVIEKIAGKYSDVFPNRILIDFYKNLFASYDAVILSGNCANMGRRNIWKAAEKSPIKSVQILRDPILLYFKDCKPSKLPLVDKVYRMVSLKDNQLIDYTVSPTKALLKAHNKAGVRFNHEKVIPNTVDNELCLNFSFLEKKDAVIYVGAVSKRKGCHTLIRAFEEIHREMPQYKLQLIGAIEDVEIPKEDYIKAYGHMDIRTVYHKIAEAKLLVLPSEWEEAFGRVVIEGVYNHTISIGSDRGGIPEIFGQHKEFIFKSGNSEELYKCMKRVLTLQQSDYEKTLNKLLTEFDRFKMENHIKQWNDFLVEVIGKKENECVF